MARPSSIGELLRRLRLERDLTLEGLSERTGISDRAIGDIERGVSAAPQRRTLAALAEGLELEPFERQALLTAGRRARSPEPEPATGSVRPHRLHDFHGRSQELGVLAPLLAEGIAGPAVRAPVLLSGPPGSGKTSLALHAIRAAEIGRPVYFVNLGGATDRPLTPLQVLQALLRQALPSGEVPATFDGASGAWNRVAAAQPCVVVLDDAGVESQTRPVLDLDARSSVIITSRRSLSGLEGVQHLRVGPLPRPVSIEFLADAIPQRQRTDADLIALAELCADLPLALRVAAGRVAAQPDRHARHLVLRLRNEDRRLRTLTAGDLGVEKAFAASYALLSDEQQQLFRDLALLPSSSFSSPAAAAIRALDPDDTTEALDGLTYLGLLEPLEQERYRLHDLVRLFAAARLGERPDDQQAADDRLRRWYLETAAQAGHLFAEDPPFPPPPIATPAVEFTSQAAADRWLRDEVDGWSSALRSSASRGRHDEVLANFRHLQAYAERFDDWGSWHDVFQMVAQSAAATGAHRLEAEYLADAAWMLNHETFNYVAARRVAKTAIAAAIRADAVAQQAYATLQAAIAEVRLDEQEAARADFIAAVDLYTRTDDVEGTLDARIAMIRHTLEEKPGRAVDELLTIREEIERRRDVLTEIYRRSMEQQVLTSITRFLTTLGRHAEAEDYATECLDLVGAAGGRDEEYARAYAERARARRAGGQHAAALEDFAAALAAAGSHRPQYWADEIEAAISSIREFVDSGKDLPRQLSTD